MNSTIFFLLRLAVGASFFGHGPARIPKLPKFSAWLVESFSKSMLPESLVLPFSYVLPVAEFVIGLLLLAGLFTRAASVAGAIVMIILIFGSCMIEDWGAIPSQMIHVIFLLGVLRFVSAHDGYSIDRLIAK